MVCHDIVGYICGLQIECEIVGCLCCFYDWIINRILLIISFAPGCAMRTDILRHICDSLYLTKVFYVQSSFPGLDLKWPGYDGTAASDTQPRKNMIRGKVDTSDFTIKIRLTTYRSSWSSKHKRVSWIHTRPFNAKKVNQITDNILNTLSTDISPASICWLFNAGEHFCTMVLMKWGNIPKTLCTVSRARIRYWAVSVEMKPSLPCFHDVDSLTGPSVHSPSYYLPRLFHALSYSHDI